MIKKVLLTILSIASLLLFTFTVYSNFKDQKAKEISVDYIANTYEGNRPVDRKGTIYDYNDGYYAVAVQTIGENECSYFLQVKMNLDLSLNDLIDASEYNNENNSMCLVDGE
jgi:hypothetical protein